jgi:hypothetical protein
MSFLHHPGRGARHPRIVVLVEVTAVEATNLTNDGEKEEDGSHQRRIATSHAHPLNKIHAHPFKICAHHRAAPILQQAGE